MKDFLNKEIGSLSKIAGDRNMNQQTILKFNSAASVRPIASLVLAILAVGAFGNFVQAQTPYLNETFSGYTNGAVPNTTLSPQMISVGAAYSITNVGGTNKLRCLKTSAAAADGRISFKLSTSTGNTNDRSVGYLTFKVKPGSGIATPGASSYLEVGLGAAGTTPPTSSTNYHFTARIYYTNTSIFSTKLYSWASSAGTNTASFGSATINSSTENTFKIWYNKGATPVTYTTPGNVATSLAANSWVVYVNDGLVSGFAAGGTAFQFPNAFNGTTYVSTVGTFATSVGASSHTVDFTLSDIYVGEIAAATAAPTLTTNSIDVTVQAGGNPVTNTISASGNPRPVFSKTGTWPDWATLNTTNGSAVFSPLPSEPATQIPLNLTFMASNSVSTTNGTFNVTVTPAASTPPVITSPTNPVVAKYLCSYPATNALYTLTSTGDDPITYSAVDLPAGLSLLSNTIIGSATTLGQSVTATLTAVNGAGTNSITLPITVAAYSWNGTGTDWNSAISWDYNGATATLPPESSTTLDVAIFGNGGSTSTVFVQDVGKSVAGVIFNEGSPAYRFSGGTLTVGYVGSIVNNSTNAITFDNKVVNNGGNATWSSVAGGSIVLNGGFECSGSGSASSRTVILGGAGDFTVAGPISNGGNTNTVVGTVTVASTGTTLFSGTNTYSGLTTVSAGANLKLGSAAALGATNGATTVIGTLDLFGFSPTGENFSLSGGSIVNSGSATSTIDGAVTIASATTINTANANITLSGVVSGGASSAILQKNGANTLTLSGTNTATNKMSLTINQGTLNVTGANSIITGTTTLNAGTLRLANSSALGATGAASTGGFVGFGGRVEATVDYDMGHVYGVSTTTNGITFDKLDGKLATFNGPVEMNVASGVTLGLWKPGGNSNASNVVTKTGTGTLQVRGSASPGLFGDWLVNEGTLFVNTSGSGSMGTNNAVVLNGGNLLYSKGVGSTGFYSGMGQDNALKVQENGTLTLDPNPATQSGANTLSFTALSIANKTLTINKGGNAKSSLNVNYVDPVLTFNTANLSGSATFNIGSNMETVLLAGTGSGGVTKTGAGKLRLMDSPNFVSATVTLTSNGVTGITLPLPVPGFTNTNPTVYITSTSNSGGSNATAQAVVSGGYLIGFTNINSGSGYVYSPQVTVVADNPVTVNNNTGTNNISGGTLNLSGSHSSSFNVQSQGVLELNYKSPSEATTTLIGTANANNDQYVKYVTLTKSVAGYTSAPVVTIDAPKNLDGSDVTGRTTNRATAIAEVANGRITRIVLDNQGQGYWALPPRVTIAPPQQGTVVATTTGSLNFESGSIVKVTVPSAPTAGSSYTLVTAAGGITGTPPTLNLVVDGAPTTGYTLSKSGNNLILEAAAPVTDGYATYLTNNGLNSATPFNAVTASGAQVGLVYAFGSASGMPQNNGVTAVPVMNGNQLTYAFDLVDDPALTVTYQTSTDLVTWTMPVAVSAGTGSTPSGFLKKQVQVTGSGKLFVRINVTRP